MQILGMGIIDTISKICPLDPALYLFLEPYSAIYQMKHLFYEAFLRLGVPIWLRKVQVLSLDTFGALTITKTTLVVEILRVCKRGQMLFLQFQWNCSTTSGLTCKV